ncbi:MAG: hypothetical protein KJ053_13275 [Dehalococcoidia bacterium]|nr:hypothetical protein [Dehalococcoidia bacterium]
MGETVRTHVVLPKELVDEIDALVGKRKRSEFIAAGLEAAVRRMRRAGLTRELMGSIPAGAVPAWDTLESTLAWQRLQRPVDDPWDDAAARARAAS